MPLLAKNKEIDYSQLEEANMKKIPQQQHHQQQRSSNTLRHCIVLIELIIVSCLITFIVWQSSFAVYRLQNGWNEPDDSLTMDENDQQQQQILLEQQQQQQQTHLLNTIAIFNSIEASMNKLFNGIVTSRDDDGANDADDAGNVNIDITSNDWSIVPGSNDDESKIHQFLLGSSVPVSNPDDSTLELVRFAGLALQQRWEEFTVKYNRKYQNVNEKELHRRVFYDNVLYVTKQNYEYSHNQSDVTFSVELNQFADQESAVIADQLNGFGKRLNVQGVRSEKALLTRQPFVRQLTDDQLPAAVDWRDKGAVTNVKNQGQCGSCWAFSATGSLEGQLYKKKGYLTSLSEQNLVDCSADEGNNGCNGGLMDNAFQYIMDNNGIDTEAEYPYQARRGRCRYVDDKLNLTDYGFFDIKSGDEKALQEAVATIGPISIAIDASQRSFQLYHGGVYKDRRCSSKNLDHGVLVVGYGSDRRGGDYWIVKNSWGEEWGEDGYIRMARNNRNMCGVATQASYPKV